MATPTSSERPTFRRLLLAGAAALVFLAGMAARSAIGDSGPRDPQAEAGATEPATPNAGPRRDAADAPAGFARSRDGARAAAVGYTATLAQRLLYLDPEAAEAAVEAVAAQASARTITGDAIAGLEAARQPLTAGTGATWWVVRPLAVKVEAYTPERARVAVWLVRVLSRQGVVVPQSSWVTETIELVWERGDWRLWSDESSPGPTPVLDGSDVPASALELDIELTGFELLDPAVSAS